MAARIVTALFMSALVLGIDMAGDYVSSGQVDLNRMRIAAAFIGLAFIGLSMSDFFVRIKDRNGKRKLCPKQGCWVVTGRSVS